ncbi:uncharacterized protein [Eurosta solidaginis]|uniref:uncharacterized protein n=1 Tax=Eurosta solidaginis TaxID=178769 RepID=UPI003530FB31
MNSVTTYFILFALIQIHLLANAKYRNKHHLEKEEKEGSEEREEPKEKENPEEKDGSARKEDLNVIQTPENENSDNKKSQSEDSDHHTSKMHPSSKKKVSKGSIKRPCKKHRHKGANGAAKQKNVKDFSAFANIPIQSSHPNEFVPSIHIGVNSPGQPDQSRQETELSYNGHLYDVFQKRLNQVFRELYHNVNSPPVTQPTPEMEYENEKPKKRSAVSNCLYEEFKRRLDKFNNEVLEPSKYIKRTSSGDAIYNAAGSKRSTVLENLSEEYKRRLDKIGNELWFDGEKVFDRNGRGAPTSLMLLTTSPKCSAPRKLKRANPDKEVKQDYFEEYKRKLDQMTRELYEKSNERISREYSDLTDQDLTSPTLQRLVPAVQLDDAKSVTGNLPCGSSSFEGSTVMDKANERLYKQQDKRSLGGSDIGTTIFGADSLNFMNGLSGAANPLSAATAAASASYPSVLTRAVDTNLALMGNTAPKNLLATVATKMNISTLDLAKKLAAMSNPLDFVVKKDPQLGAEMQQFIDLAVHNSISPNQQPKKLPINEVSIVSGLPLLGPDSSGLPQPLMPQGTAFSGALQALTSRSTPKLLTPPTTEPPCDLPTTNQPPCNAAPTNASPAASHPQTPPITTQQPNEADAARIASVLDKVLGKLENIQNCKANEESSPFETCEPDGVPCDVVGSWNSNQMGLRFDISLNKAADRRLGAAEKNNRLLQIEVGERIPPHSHHLIETSWKFMGSALNQQGGPFYIYTQNRELGIVANFIGYCRICGDIDTIFGSWTIMGPSKDCEDVTTALENKRDILRRYNMENKRNLHFKDKLFEKSKYAKPEC